MLGNVTGYASIHGHVRAMYSRLLTSQVRSRLAEAPDLNALLALLKETAYGAYLVRVEDKALTPKRAVYQIKRRLADAYVAVIRLALPHTRPLLLQLYRRFELDNLKAILRGIVAGTSWDQVRYVLFPLGSITCLPAQAMVEAGNVPAAVEQLRGTPYYGTLSHALKRYAAEQNLFPLEVALDLAYWRELWLDVNQLPGQERTRSLRIVGPLVDANNLMWAIRYRIYHRLSEEEIINYTLPFGYRVRDDQIRAIAAGADIFQVLTRVYPRLIAAERQTQVSQGWLPELELQLQRQIAAQCKAAFSGYPFHVGIPLAYLLLSEQEIQDLTVMIEAKAAHMSTEKFRDYLLVNHLSA